MPPTATITSWTDTGTSPITLYLLNSTNVPTPDGNPAVSNTTPFSINMQSWTLTAPDRNVIYAGSPPFRIGRIPQYVGFDIIEETVEIGIAATTATSVYNLIARLRRALNGALIGPPAIFRMSNTGTQEVAFEIYSANVQETGEWLNPTAGFGTCLVRVTWQRSPFGGQINSGATALTGTNFGSTGRGSQPMIATAIGDMRYEGQPLNIDLIPVDGLIDCRFFASTCAVTAETTPYGTIPVSTTSTAGVALTSTSVNPFGVFTTPSVRNLKGRVIQLLGVNAVGNAEVQCTLLTKSTTRVVWQSPWINTVPDTFPGITEIALDYGPIDPFIFRSSNLTLTEFNVNTSLRSTNGANATVTPHSIIWLEYYTFAQIDIDRMSGATGHIHTFLERTNRPALPLPQPFIGSITVGTGLVRSLGTIRGTYPQFREGATLFLMWGDQNGAGNNGGIMSVDNTIGWGVMTVNARYAPLFSTLRGNP